MWTTMEDSPGYRVLLEGEFAEIGFREPFRLAFMPSKQSELDKAIKSGKHRYLSHYSGWAKGALARMKGLGRELAQLLDFEELTSLAKAFLPPGEYRQARVSVVLFCPDARGYDPIVLDVGLIELMPPDDVKLMVAHEFHHYFRNQLKTRRAAFDLVRDAIYWGLDQLQAEGIADQINVPSFLAGDSGGKAMVEARNRYRTLLAGASDSLSRFETVVLSVARGELTDPAEVRKAVRKALPMSGHPTGYFMASTIIRGLGRERLIKHMADPVKFLEDYQIAAGELNRKEGKNTRHLLDKEAMTWLRLLRDHRED